MAEGTVVAAGGCHAQQLDQPLTLEPPDREHGGPDALSRDLDLVRWRRFVRQ